MANSARIDELLKKFDENPKRYFAPLANEYRKAGDVDQAIALCREHLAQQPGHMSGHVVYGQALYEKGELDEARQVFETALALDPENLIALRHLGDIARDRHDLGTARMWYQRVLDSDPRNEEIVAQLATLPDGLGSPPAEGTPTGAEAPATEPAIEAAAEPTSEPAIKPAIEPAIEPLGEPALPPLDGALVGEGARPASATADESVPGALAASEAPSAAAEMRPEPLELESTAFAPAAPSASAPPATEPGPVTEPAREFDIGNFGGVEPTAVELSGAEAGSAQLSGFESHDFLAPASSAPAPDDLGLEPAEFVPPPRDTESEAAELGSRDADLISGFGDLSAVAYTEPSAATESAPSPPSGPEQPEPELLAATAASAIDARGHDAIAGDASADDAALAQAPSETPGAFVTETMAELYLQQGFRREALEVYRQLHAQNPHDGALQVRVERLEAELREAGGSDADGAPAPRETALGAPTEAGEARPAGPTARAFFSALAARRPRPGALNGVGSGGIPQAANGELPPVGLDAAPAAAVDAGELLREHSADAEGMSTAGHTAPRAGGHAPESYFQGVSEGLVDGAPDGAFPGGTPDWGAAEHAANEDVAGRGEAHAGVGEGRDRSAAGADAAHSSESLDALFGAPEVPGQDEAAASMLARLYDPAAEAAPPAGGSATRPAASELSLDQVFRETPRSHEAARRSAFSFDQFFAAPTEQEAGGQDAAGVSEADHEDENAARDIEQFHAWLEGLKKK